MRDALRRRGTQAEPCRLDQLYLDASLAAGQTHCLRAVQRWGSDQSHSATNKLILNFKKPVSRRGKPEWRYKAQAVGAVAGAFSSNIGKAFGSITLVPVPPSKLKTDPEYDDRMMDMLRALRSPAGMVPDVRELVIQTMPMPAAHESAIRPPPSEWEKVYAIDETLAVKEPQWIGIIDDLFVTGCRYRCPPSAPMEQFGVIA